MSETAVILRLAASAIVALAALAGGGALAGPTVVIDADSGAVLHADQAGTPWYPASLTKLMTAYLTFERLRDDPEFTLATKLPMTELGAKQPPSKIGIAAGTDVTVRKALEALIIYSANDIAVALAERVGGSFDDFIDDMNGTAARLGMTATRFYNPNGLPEDGQVTTARDLAILGRAIYLDFPEYADLFAMDVLRWGKKHIRARNSFLRSFEGADGMKTGYICASGYNLVASASRDGKRLIAVVLGAPSGDYRTQIAAHLLATAFARGAQPMLDFTSVETLSNAAARHVAPADLRDDLCSRDRERPQIAKASELDGWGVNFGEFDTTKTARAALDRGLAALRGVARHGKAAVVKNGAGNLAVLAGLTLDEALQVCGHLAKGGMACAALSPGAVKNPATVKH
jgi:D-alanyl-D-alanine carboxypeptidase